jgi:hypothetical protein
MNKTKLKESYLENDFCEIWSFNMSLRLLSLQKVL